MADIYMIVDPQTRISWHVYIWNCKHIGSVCTHITNMRCKYICKHMPYGLWILDRITFHTCGWLSQVFTELLKTWVLPAQFWCCRPRVAWACVFLESSLKNDAALLESHRGACAQGEMRQEGCQPADTLGRKGIRGQENCPQEGPVYVLIYVKPFEPTRAMFTLSYNFTQTRYQ